MAFICTNGVGALNAKGYITHPAFAKEFETKEEAKKFGDMMPVNTVVVDLDNPAECVPSGYDVFCIECGEIFNITEILMVASCPECGAIMAVSFPD